MIKLKTAKKFFAIFANFSLLLNSFTPFLLAAPAYAEEPIPSPTPTPQQVVQEVTPQPSPIIEITPKPTVSIEPTISLDPTITPELTSTPEITVAPTETITPTPEPTVTITPTITLTEAPTITPTETPVLLNEKVCLTDEQIIDSTTDQWNIDDITGTVETKEKVQLGVHYINPQENGVSITFKCLPKDESQRTTLKIEKIKTSELNFPEGISNVGEYAYDITTGMVDGTFEYDITLPKPADSTAEISYIEKTVEQAKTELSFYDINKIDNSKIEQQDNTVKALNVDHFTIFVATYSNITLTIEKENFIKGNTVYIKATGSDLTLTKLRIKNPNGVVTKECDPALSTEIKCDYQIPSNAQIGKYTIDVGHWFFGWFWTNNKDSFNVLTSVCGDSTISGNEQCDDGNSNNTDFCSNTCQINHKNISICHATSSEGNPFTNPTVDDDSIVKNNGHDEHDNDIIPSFDYYGGHYDGKNLDTIYFGQTGEEILNNGCKTNSSLTLIKSWADVYNSGYIVTDWTLSAIGTGLSLVGQGNVSGNLPAGDYTLSESGPTGTSSAWDCTGGAVLNGDILTLSLGQNITCTITNTPIQPQLTVTKKVVGSDESVSNFPLFVGGVSVVSGNTNGFNVGKYLITETPNSNYNAVFSGDCNVEGEISLSLGDKKNCTITNTRKTGTIQVLKNVDLNGDGDYYDINETNASDWKWQINGQEYNTGSAAVSIPTGIYTLTETQKPNFHFGSLNCVGGILNGNNISVIEGANVICTFENIADTGSVLAHKYSDINASGSQELGESNLSGWNMALYSGSDCQDANLIYSGITDNGGNYTFNTLVVGNYSVKETNKTGWRNISNLCQNVSVVRDNQSVVNFANQELGKVTVYKFNDLNANGTRDANEPYLSDWTINLTDQVSLATGSNGSTSFNNLTPNANYTLSENIQEGWYQSGIYCDGNGTKITAPGEAYGHHGACSGWNGYDAATMALWACEVKGYTNLVSYGEDRPCTQFNNCNLFYGRGSIQWNWGNWCNVQGVTDIVCSNSSSSSDNGFINDVGYSSTNQNYQLTVAAGQNRTCYVGNYQKASVIVTKFNDINENGYQDEGEPNMSDWTVNLTGQESSVTNKDGNLTFSQLTPSSYSLSENLKDGWRQTNIICDGEEAIDNDNSHQITLTSGQNLDCKIGNKFIPPTATISKSNNAIDDLSPGNSVSYFINLTISDNFVQDFKVTDLLSDGFKYRAGSYKITKNGFDITSSISEPQYHSPGVWNLGHLEAGDKLELSYIADISTNQQPGKYSDIAYGSGNYNADNMFATTLLASANEEADGYIASNFVGTDVVVNRSYQNSFFNEVNKTETRSGSVLGASTEMPSTGASILWLILSPILGIIGINIMKKKKITTLLITILLISGFTKNVFATDSLVIRLEEPKTPSNTKNLELKFVTLDTENQSITVQCFKKSPTDSGFSQFGSDIILTNGGNSAACSLNQAITDAGSYQFQTKAITASSTIFSNIVTLDYKTIAPGTPGDYSKNEINDCDYKIHFKTAQDEGKTVKVEIYRADITSFTLDDGSRVASINIGSDQEYNFTNSVPDCSKNYYYALRAFDNAGNSSNVVGDSNINYITSSTNTNTVSGAIPVAGNVISKEESDKAKPTDQGTVLGEQKDDSNNVSVKFQSFISRHKIISTLIAIAVLVIIGYGVKKIKSKNKKKRK